MFACFLTLDDCVDKLRMSTVIKRIYDYPYLFDCTWFVMI